MTSRRIFLIGAARSGTKVLRDVLGEAAQVGVVPYDVNFVWKYGHQRVPHDALDPTTVQERQRRFVSSYLDRYAAGSPPVVIEKTVGNSLRVPFLHAMFPDAAFVHLVRDGVDAVESTRRQWQTPPDRRYLARKLRHFPPRLLPTYGVSFARAQLPSRDGRQLRVRSWGVRYPGIDDDVRREPLLTVCARQWRASVEGALAAFDQLSVPVVDVRYEQLVADPSGELARLLEALGLPADDRALRAAAGRVSGDRAGVGALALETDERDLLEAEIGATLRRLGYPAATDPDRSRPMG